MDGNTREFMGIVSDVEVSTVYDVFGAPVTAVNPELNVEIPGNGTLVGIRFTDDVEEARALLGRKVRVTVEVLDD